MWSMDWKNKGKVLVTRSCLTLCNPTDCSLPGSSIPGILQAIILEWVAIPFSRESSWPRDQPRSPILQAICLPSKPPGKPKVWIQSLSHVWLCNPMACSTPGLPVHHQLLELAQTHVHWVSDDIQPSHPLLSTAPAFSLPASQSFPRSQFYVSGGQSIEASASA